MRPRTRRGGGRPTIADVARLAGVGAITVSRALREPERVSEGLRQQIQRAVEELGYLPDPNARALASARAEVFGVLVPSLTNNVFAEVVRGIYDNLSDSPFRVQLANTHYSGLEEERLLQLFLSQRPAALIVSGIVRMSFNPFAAATKASAIPVLPDVGSIRTVFWSILPAFNASSIMEYPIRSLTLESGLKNSSFNTTLATTPCFSAVRLRRTNGVLPMVSMMEL